jgi:G:T-mismatch repair DNA endonuclease (very short patch repair protein)
MLLSAGGRIVCSTPVEVPAAARARWLAEVAETLEQAEHLLNRLKRDGHRAANFTELTMRIEAAKHEVALLRLSRQSRAQTDPKWTKLPPWEDGGRSSV